MSSSTSDFGGKPARRWLRGTPQALAVTAGVAALTLLVDQGTKALAIADLREDERIALIGDLLGLQLAFNPGAILSFGAGSTLAITIFTVLSVLALIVAATRLRSLLAATGVGFILGGGLGNLVDRMVAPPAPGRGMVTDFIAYGDLFIGNLADVALGVGVGLLLLLGLRSWLRARRSESNARAAPSSNPEVSSLSRTP
ncbi:MAG: signal peptidase II [Actinomycetales bacterium]|nr:signal peptidase II [Actinomycetales bacterium]